MVAEYTYISITLKIVCLFLKEEISMKKYIWTQIMVEISRLDAAVVRPQRNSQQKSNFLHNLPR